MKLENTSLGHGRSFEASVTGTWPKGTPTKPKDVDEAKAEEDVDEDAPKSIAELSELTSLSESLLDELEQSLLAKQQTVLVGPPGTSKTYIARQFARYFVRQRTGASAGKPPCSLHARQLDLRGLL